MLLQRVQITKRLVMLIQRVQITQKVSYVTTKGTNEQ